MARVYHPRHAKGTIVDRFADIIYIDGVAEVDFEGKPRLRTTLLAHGYRIEEGGAKITKAKLLEEAKELGIAGATTMTKAELTEAIAETAPRPDPVPPHDADEAGE